MKLLTSVPATLAVLSLVFVVGVVVVNTINTFLIFYTLNENPQTQYRTFEQLLYPKNQNTLISQENIRKRRLFKKVQAFCEEKVLRYLVGVFWYADFKKQCWQAEKWRLHYLICIFPRWPPN